MLRLHNTLTKRIEPFEPLRAGHVGMYTCGPTVYREVHLRNLRSYLLADWLRRVLTYVEGYDVTHSRGVLSVSFRELYFAQMLYNAGDMHNKLKRRHTFVQLTPTERRVLVLAAHGHPTKQIAARLRVGERTVRWHLANIHHKLNARSRAHAVALALSAGLLPPLAPHLGTSTPRTKLGRPGEIDG